MNHSKATRFLALLLAVVMVIGYVPVSAFATEDVEENAAPETVTVFFDVNGGVGEYEDQVVTIGEMAMKPEQDPTYEGFEFAYWAADLESGIAWSFEENAVTEDMTLYAAWAASAEAADEVTIEESDDEVTIEGGDDEITIEEENEVQPVTYTVNYYKWDWDLEADVLIESEELTGIPGEQTNVQDKGYEGLILMDDIVQVEIAADGSTVVNVYYIVEPETAIPWVSDSDYDTAVSEGYYTVISKNKYTLAPGAIEKEIVLNNADGSRRQIVHIFEVDTKEEELEIMPGYYGIDKLDPNNLALDGVADKSQYWKAEQLTKTVKYYENMGYNVVGAMNTALAYDSNAPYGYMVWNGVVLGNPQVHSGAQTYLAINWDGTCELRAMSTPLTGNEKTAIPANFDWLVKDGALVSKTPERTTSPASRSMIGIKEDGTLVFCQVDGRVSPTSVGLSNYEMGEMMLALGCINAVNCDGGGSSTFVSKRAGESEGTMRSIPSDGSERPTINSVILVSTAGATGVFAEVQIDTGYDYIAPTASMAISVKGFDTKTFEMEIPAEVTYQVAEEGMGSIENGVFTAGTATGTATIQAVYNGEVVGKKVLNVVHPEIFGFTAETTALPMDKTLELELKAIYGTDDWDVCIDGAWTMELVGETYGSSLNGNVMSPTPDAENEYKSVTVKVTYTPDTTKTDTISVMFGEASKVIIDFEDGDRAGFMGFAEAKQWSLENNVDNTLGSDNPLAGQFNSYLSSKTTMATAANGGQVRNGQYALAWTLDNTDASFASWSYNVLFNVGERIVFRDTANGLNATALGMWIYIPEGAAGLAFQSQFWGTLASDGSTGCKQDHFMFTSAKTGKLTNLNGATEEDIPANRWVYASIDITKYSYLSTMEPQSTASNSRSPSFVRTYVKPNGPSIHTFYIDDITLDYSSAVDDRVPPVIGELQYANQDTTLPVEEAVIKTNAATFSATVTDNTSLNTSSAQIYIDGNKVATQIQGKNMFTSEDVVMNNGSHVVTFEISDKMGNEFQTSARFTVEYAEAELEQGLVYVTGHNDSGLPAEYDSVYYVDIMTSDIAQIDNVELNIKLNNANTWELEHAPVAEGFSFEYEVLSLDDRYTTFALTSDIHSTDNVAVVTITKTGETSLTGEQTLISLPVRLWSWDGHNYVTDKSQAPHTNKPTVTIDYNVLFGCAETVSGEYVSFGGSGSVATNMNYGGADWHTHDKVLTVLNKEATCTMPGYENRTYCEGCKSVIDWGTKIPAPGHSHEIVGDEIKCHCGDIIGGNGLVTVNGKIYVLIADKLVTGWQNVDNKWVYADHATMEVQTGEFSVSGRTYTADEEGFVIKGAWVTDAKGTKYSYGPSFYKREWAEIDGKTYYFGTDSYIYTGIRSIPVNRNNEKESSKWYEFAQTGELVQEYTDYTGFLWENDTKYYIINGLTSYANHGIIQIDGEYYCLAYTGYVYRDCTMNVTNTHGLLPAGTYTFDEEGRLVGLKNGVCVDEADGLLYYYENGWKTFGGLMYLDSDGDGKADAYYYAMSSGQIVCDKSYWISKTNDLLPAKKYTFGTDGKMIDPPTVDPDIPVIPEEQKNGIVKETDGKLYYYENGKLAYGGLMLIDGDYYYATSAGEIICNRSYWISKTNNLLPEKKYTFGADGKMIDPPTVDPDIPVIPEEQKNGIVKETDGKLYYYENGKLAYGGLMLIDGDYYYATSAGEIICSKAYWITKTNDLLPAKKYTFGADGKMIDPPTVHPEEPAPEVPKNGLYTATDGNMYYYENGKLAYGGLMLIDGDYYYATSAGEIIRNRTYWISKTNNLLPEKKYTFGDDGKMIDPPVVNPEEPAPETPKNGLYTDADGNMYYYENGKLAYGGLMLIDGDYYYATSAGEIIRNRTYWITKTNDLLPATKYTFGADGKMVNPPA